MLAYLGAVALTLFLLAWIGGAAATDPVDRQDDDRLHDPPEIDQYELFFVRESLVVL